MVYAMTIMLATSTYSSIVPRQIRRYCTTRLRRLYKSLKFTHGRAKYSCRVITESIVTGFRFLHVILDTTERAWSHAMEKRQFPDGPNRTHRIYLIVRLRKAVNLLMCTGLQ